jgi:hypothetical protein
VHIFRKSSRLSDGARSGAEMSTPWRQYDCNCRGRQQRLKEIQGYELVLIFSWLGALLTWGFLWWAAFRLLLLHGPTCSVRSGVIAMITEASYSDNLRPALAYVNTRPDRTSRWWERWMIHRQDGSFALYLVNWGVRSRTHFQPSLTRIPELVVPQVVTAFDSPQPANKKSGVLEWLVQ